MDGAGRVLTIPGKHQKATTRIHSGSLLRTSPEFQQACSPRPVGRIPDRRWSAYCSTLLLAHKAVSEAQGSAVSGVKMTMTLLNSRACPKLWLESSPGQESWLPDLASGREAWALEAGQVGMWLREGAPSLPSSLLHSLEPPSLASSGTLSPWPQQPRIKG